LTHNADGHPTRPFRRTASLPLLTGSRRRFCATPPPALCATTTSAREDKTTTTKPLIACSAATTGVTSMIARQVGSSGAPESNTACHIHNVRAPLPACPTRKVGIWWWWRVGAGVVRCIFVGSQGPRLACCNAWSLDFKHLCGAPILSFRLCRWARDTSRQSPASPIKRRE